MLFRSTLADVASLGVHHAGVQAGSHTETPRNRAARQGHGKRLNISRSSHPPVQVDLNTDRLITHMLQTEVETSIESPECALSTNVVLVNTYVLIVTCHRDLDESVCDSTVIRALGLS